MSKTVIIPERLRPTKTYLNEILKKMNKLGYIRFGDSGINELYCKLHRKNNYVYVTENPCSSKPRTLVMTYENWADLYLMGYDTEYLTPKEVEEINKVHNKEDLSHKKGDKVNCIIEAEIVPAIPLNKIEQIRKQINDKYDNTVSAFDERGEGRNDMVCTVLEILDELIEQYNPKNKEENEELEL